MIYNHSPKLQTHSGFSCGGEASSNADVFQSCQPVHKKHSLIALSLQIDSLFDLIEYSH